MTSLDTPESYEPWVDPLEVESGFSEMPAMYASLKSRSEQAVTTWRWATFDVEALEPLWFERHQFGKGRWIKDRPKDINGLMEYGFDAAGRTRVVREHITFDQPARHFMYETFFIDAGAFVKRYRYHYHQPGQPISATFVRLVNGVAAATVTIAEHGSHAETYGWADGLPTEVREWRFPDSSMSHHSPQQSFVYRAEYVQRKHTLLRRFPSAGIRDLQGDGEVMFRRQAPKETFAQMIAVYKETLLTAIESVLRGCQFPAAAKCAAIPWSPGQTHCLPASIAVGLESDFKRFRDQHPEVLVEFAWNPAEFRTWIDLPFDPHDRVVHEIQQHCWQKDSWSAVGRALNEVCKALSERVSAESLRADSNFFIYATDLDLDDLTKNIRFACPAEKLNDLVAAGELPKKLRTVSRP